MRSPVSGRSATLLVYLASLFISTVQADTAIQGMNGITISVQSTGSYSVVVPSSGWQFGGSVDRPLSNVAVNSGADGIGPYTEIAFDYTVEALRRASIRSYLNRQAVLFSITYVAASPNSTPFPTLTEFPQNLSHLTYSGIFALPSFPGFSNEGPWIFFDSQAYTFLLSPAANFLVSNTAFAPNGAIATGISTDIPMLPAGFSHQTLLVVEQGVNRGFETWGRALTDLAGKVRPANDVDTSLNLLGYWTDNGSTYYYRSDPSMSYTDTLAAVKSDFDRQGIPLGYMQLDSWFYPKGVNADWKDSSDGIYQYSGAAALFSPSLRDFQQSLGIPLITHARWIDANSPYRQQFRISGNVAIDPAYWSHTANYISNAGAATYEQDWLGAQAHTDFNLTDPYAFLDNMSAAMAQSGLTMQYCMATPRHFLQSTKYGNLTTIRSSEDRFGRTRWTNFLYSSRLAGALGIWPFTDVFMSAETVNLVLATLSAGPVGVGDPLGGLDKANLLRAVRPDGVIVKPDAPLVPLDKCYLNDANSLNAPMIASTFTDFGDLNAYYLFAYSQGSQTPASFSLADLGSSTPAYVYNYFTKVGTLAGPNDVLTDPLASGTAYYVIAPVGRSGIAMLGDLGQFVSLGKKRITRLTDDGTAHLAVAFARGETSRILQGYSASQPTVTAITGCAGPADYDSDSQRFTIIVGPGPDGTASLDIGLAPQSPVSASEWKKSAACVEAPVR